MSFKHTVSIDPQGDECGNCPYVLGDSRYTLCGIFGKRLRIGGHYRTQRCADCKKAEARAAKKEPTNG